MKRVLFAIPLSLLFLACGGENKQTIESVVESGNLEAIRAKRTAIHQEYQVLEQQLETLDAAIGKLDNNEKFPLVTIYQTRPEEFKHFLELRGDVMTKQNVLIYPEMSGVLEEVLVQEGQRVQEGQLLARIDDGGMTSQLAQMKTQLELAKTTYERQKRLWDQQIGSEIQFLQAKSSYEAQESAVAQMESQLGKAQITAPFSGILDDVIKDEGTVVAPGPGSEVFRIVNLSNMYIDVEVPESHLGSVTKGKDVMVYFPALQDSVVSQVRETGNYINPNNRSFRAEIPVPNKDGMVKPNLMAKVAINDYTNTQALLIPLSAISENAQGEQYVYVAEEIEGESNLVVTRHIIKTGLTQGSQVEVKEGLQQGDKIVIEGARSVKDGQKVQILE